MTGDLHCHSRFSDGSMTVERIADYARCMNLDYIALTDHDTTESFESVDIISQKSGVKLIKGVELSAFDFQRGRKVHILCYMPLYPEKLQRHCETVCNDRRAAAKRMTEMVSKYYPICLEDVLPYAEGCASLYKQHILHALVDRGYSLSVFGELFKTLFNTKNGTCYVSCPAPDVYKVLDLVKQAGGIAVFAHPGEYDSYELLKEVCERGLIDGIEVWHTRNKPDDAERLSALANRYDLIKTGGSDFHGMYSSRAVPIGNCKTPQESFERLMKKAEDIRKVNLNKTEN